MAQTVARALANGGLVMASGLARGIDSRAHQGALSSDTGASHQGTGSHAVMELGRALCGNATQPSSFGPNQLIKQGAKRGHFVGRCD